MKQDFSDQPCHRVSCLRAHPFCKRPAWVCERRCQEVHDASETIELSLQCADQMFENINGLIESIIVECTKQIREKHGSATLRNIQRQLKTELIRALPISEEMFAKMQNKAYELISCAEMMSLIESSSAEQILEYKAIQQICQKIKTPAKKLREPLLDRQLDCPQKMQVEQSQKRTKEKNQRQIEDQIEESYFNDHRSCKDQGEVKNHQQSSQGLISQLKSKIQQLNKEKQALMNQTLNLQKQLRHREVHEQRKINIKPHNMVAKNRQKERQSKIGNKSEPKLEARQKKIEVIDLQSNDQQQKQQKDIKKISDELQSKPHKYVRSLSTHLTSLQSNQNAPSNSRPKDDQDNPQIRGYFFFAYPRKRRPQ